MTTYTRHRLDTASGRYAAARRHHPDSDHTPLVQDLIEATAGYRFQSIRDQYPGVDLRPEQVQDLLEVLK